MTLECRDCGRGLVGGVYVSSGGVHRCRGCHEKMLNHWAERFRRKLGRGYVEEEAGVMRRLEPEVVEVVEAVEAEAEPVREAGAGAWRLAPRCAPRIRSPVSPSAWIAPPRARAGSRSRHG